MEGLLTHFRGGMHTQYNNQMIAVVNGVVTRDSATKLLKKTVTWTSPAGKEIKGYVSSVHGNKGALRLVFEKGMPGQAIVTKVKFGD